jgi:hypothetical protein
MKAAHEDAATGRIMFRDLFLHVATAPRQHNSRSSFVGTSDVRLRRARAGVGLLANTGAATHSTGERHPASSPGVGYSGTGDRCAVAARRRAARRTRRLPVSSSSSAMSVRTASGVSAAASGVNSHSIIPRFRYRNVSRWQHLTRSSSGPTQYPVAQVAQDQFFFFAVLLNQPWATRQ